MSLNPYPLLGGIVLILALYGGHRYVVYSEVSEAKTVLVAKYDKRYNDLVAKSNQIQKELNDKAAKNKADKDKIITSNNAELARLLNELHKRPKRSDTNPSTTKGGQAITGASLSAEDAEFLTREASRADNVTAERDYYYKSYVGAEAQLEVLRRGEQGGWVLP